MHSLYTRVEVNSMRGEAGGSDLVAVADALDAEHPTEWLLRFFVLKALQQRELAPQRRRLLVSQLAALERHYGGRCPIATGLRYLGHAADS